jgi:heme/copper-type cytochrome/quinol oxidase subunit 3
MSRRRTIDIGDLPTYGFGACSPMWWGTFAFIAVEGTGFALAIASYLYLRSLSPDWPIDAPPPDLLPGTIVTAILLASAVPNYFAKRWAREEDLRKVRIGVLAMTVLGIVPLIVRAFEFTELNIRWDSNAYGSLLWLLLGLHTVHLGTDVGESAVLSALMFTRHGMVGRRFSDVEDNGVYWDFVVLSWLPIYALIYWVPRL